MSGATKYVADLSAGKPRSVRMKSTLFFLCFAVFCGCLCAQDLEEMDYDATVPPIPQSPKTRLSRDVEAENLKWAERVLVAPFKERAKGQPWSAEATAFVGRAIAYWADLNLASLRLGELPAEATKVIQSGCRDPLVLYLYGVVHWADSGEWRDGFNELEEALKAVETDPKYSRALAHFIARDLGDRYEKSGRSAKHLATKSAEWISQSWKDGSYLAGDESLFVHHEMGRWKHIFGEDPAKTKAAYENVPLPEWARVTMLAALSDERALAWRRANPNNKRPADIAELSTAAYQGYAKAWKLNPAEPWAAAQAVRFPPGIHKPEGEPDQREWFDRAVTAQFDLSAAYRFMVDAYFGGYGNRDTAFAFGRACLETYKFDTIVPSFFRVVVTRMASRTRDPRAFYAEPKVARPLISLCLAKLRDKSSRTWPDWWNSWLVVYAWLSNEPKHAEAALAELKNGLDPEALTLLSQLQIDETTMRGEIAIAKAGQTARLKKLTAMLDEGDRTNAEQTIETIAKAAGPSAAGLVRALRSRVDFENQFAKGDWVKLQIPDRLEGWTVISGAWDARDGEILLKGNDKEAVLLAPGRAGNRFEIRGEASIQVGTNCCRSFGVMCGFMRRSYSIALSSDQRGAFEQKAYVWPMIGTLDHHAPQPRSELKPDNKFYCRADEQLLTFELNGKKYFDNYKLVHSGVPANGRFGFVIMKACAANSWRIKNIEVRKLPEP